MKTQCTWFFGVWLAAVSAGQGGVAVPAAAVGPDFATEFEQAEGALRGGRVQEALRKFQRLQWGVGTVEEGVQAGIAAATCQQMLGMDCSATETLELAQLRLKDGQSATTVNLKLALANAAMRQRKYGVAAEHLKGGLELARTLKDTRAEARVLLTSGLLTGMRLIEQAPRDFSVRDSRGMVLETREAGPLPAYEQIRKPFDAGLALAGKAGDASLELQGRLNLAKVAILFGDDAGAGQQLKAAMERLQGNVALDANGAFWLSCGESWLWLRELSAAKSKSVGVAESPDAKACLERAAALAQAAEQHSILSYARGYQARLARTAGQLELARQQTGLALFHAQKARDQMASFLWQWQTGQLEAARGNRTEAHDFYKLATDSFKSIRKRVSATDLLFKFGPLGAEGVYYELAELNFEQADQATDPAQKQKLLVEARQAIESFKAFQIESQFLSRECAQLLDNLTGNVEAMLGKMERNTAVIYVIPLAGRTEVMATLPDGTISRFTLKRDRSALNQEAGELRQALAEKQKFEGAPLKAAQGLYDALLRPLEEVLAKQGVQQLVFILDGALSSIPMAALHDGKQFLIEKHAVAIAPGLSMVEPAQKRTQQPRVLLAGLTTEEPPFSKLANIEQEVNDIRPRFAGTTLLGEQFTRENVQRILRDEPVSILHLASHGQFSSSAEDTFIVTHGGRISLDDLETFVRPLVLRETPLEMLVMSACETAKGNSRAAFGLAGVAIKSGARSVVATLWQVDDLAMTTLMSGFYGRLAGEGALSKAEALRQAQLELLKSKEHRHPYFWAPCILLGNWL